MNICMQHYRDFMTDVDSLDSAKRCQISGHVGDRENLKFWTIYCNSNCIIVLSSLITMRPADCMISCSVARTTKWVWDPCAKLTCIPLFVHCSMLLVIVLSSLSTCVLFSLVICSVVLSFCQAGSCSTVVTSYLNTLTSASVSDSFFLLPFCSLQYVSPLCL